MKLVVIESPYAGTEEEIERNIRYARACMRDCLQRGEYPFASHLLYTQEGILNDKIPEERRLGIEAGYEWGFMADCIMFYTDLGMSNGMTKALEFWNKGSKQTKMRTLSDWNG